MSKWEKQVQRTRDRWKVTELSYLCSDHFTEDCVEVDFSSKFGIKKKRRQLIPGAIPTIFHRQQPAKDQQKLSLSRKRPSTGKNEDDDGTCSKRKRLVMKRERHEVTTIFFYKKDCI